MITAKLLGIALIATLAITAQPTRLFAQNAPTVEELRMPIDSAPYRKVADDFVLRASAGELNAVQGMMSARLVERSGQDAIRRTLQVQIVPFFQGRAPGRSVTTTMTTDASGQRGYAFYMWMRDADGQRPFTVYTVEEQGRIVVANVVPDRLVEGRHR